MKTTIKIIFPELFREMTVPKFEAKFEKMKAAGLQLYYREDSATGVFLFLFLIATFL